MSRTYPTADSMHNQEKHAKFTRPFSLAEGGVWGRDYTLWHDVITWSTPSQKH